MSAAPRARRAGKAAWRAADATTGLMKFAVGYPSIDGPEPFLDLVREYRPYLAEVYFPWGDLPSGRAALTVRRGYVDWAAQGRLEADLRAFRAMGLDLNLLFNAACYGGRGASQALANLVCSVLDHLANTVGGVQAVTTSSLAVAHTVKRHDPGIAVRASVNMRIGTTQAMEAVADLFDGFCVQRDVNRAPAHLRRLRAWADARGKQVSLLANSGCLRYCPAQAFHDTLVAHEQEIDETHNLPDWTPHVCRALFRRRAHWPALLQATWIRPEDLPAYANLVPVVKLATRMHDRPRMVLDAYARGRYRGNLLDLLEPGFARQWAPWRIENDRFPDDWAARTADCAYACDTCGYCARVLSRVLVSDLAPDADVSAAAGAPAGARRRARAPRIAGKEGLA